MGISMECDLVVVVMEGPGMGMKVERVLQNFPSILFHALLIDKKNVNLMIHFIGFKIWKWLQGFQDGYSFTHAPHILLRSYVPQSTELDVKDKMVNIYLILFSLCTKWRFEFFSLSHRVGLEFKEDSITYSVTGNNTQ